MLLSNSSQPSVSHLDQFSAVQYIQTSGHTMLINFGLSSPSRLPTMFSWSNFSASSCFLEAINASLSVARSCFRVPPYASLQSFNISNTRRFKLLGWRTANSDKARFGMRRAFARVSHSRSIETAIFCKPESDRAPGKRNKMSYTRTILYSSLPRCAE